ncbi:MAG: DUF2589 domain-containing protein [Saprospiraceae bacterium]|nr:DUF2589 domain-containing protein [Saprospiraceae bacterium]
MEKTLKEFLSENHQRKNKDKLISAITGISRIIGEEKYAEITGVQLSELDDLSKSDLVGTLNQFINSYQEDWEKSLSEASVEVKLMLGFNDIVAEMNELSKSDFSAQSGTSASNANFAAELGSIDFANMIGGPLNACVTAQNNASMATVSFINEVGFTDPATTGGIREVRMVDFTHKRKTINPDYDPAQAESATNVKYSEEDIALEVPFLSILNIPSLRIETCEIDFNVKLNSVYTKDVSSEFQLDASLGIDYKWIKFDVSASYKRSMSTGVRVEKEYNLGVKVVATNDQLPGGLENVLGILAG